MPRILWIGMIRLFRLKAGILGIAMFLGLFSKWISFLGVFCLGLSFGFFGGVAVGAELELELEGYRILFLELFELEELDEGPFFFLSPFLFALSVLF